MICAKINNENVEVEENTTILEAAQKIGYKIPALCYKKGLSVYGGCRICVVEMKGRETLIPACSTILETGMEIYTNTEKVRAVRKNIFELIIANHPFDCKLNCLTCSRNESCELRKLAVEIGVEKLKFEFVDKEWDTDSSSKGIIRENSKCISCTRCIRTCKEIQHAGVLTLKSRGPNTIVTTYLDKGMGNVDCTNCGQCIMACPTGAIHEVYHIQGVINALNDPKKHVIVQTAPAIRVSLGEEFGILPGTNIEGKIVTALKKIGFDKVFDTNFTADLTIVEEAYELVDRIKNNGKFPMITSCSPGWVLFAEHNLDDLSYLSTCKSPQQMFGALAKSYYPVKANIPPENIVSVSIMPCTAKKYEMARTEMFQNGVPDVDFVLTTRELAKLIKEYNIDITNLQDSEYDSPFSITTGAGAIFGATGGVMEAALRTAYEVITGKTLEELDFKILRGMNGIKEAEVDINGMTIKVAVASGLENAYQLLKNKDKYHFIEIMGCPGGCIGGGGQPFSDDENIKEKRISGIYDIDAKRTLRKSHENPQIKKLYEEFLKEPLSDVAHKYLHTHYKKR